MTAPLGQLYRASLQDPDGRAVLQDALLQREDHRRLVVLGLLPAMALIPAGSFLMGSPPDEKGRCPDEGPQRRVTISRGFWLGRVPVTQALYEAATGTNPSEFQSPDRPVECVSWHDAQVFLAQLNELLPGFGFRLTTEAEWEYACRAGTTAPRYGRVGRIAWHGGNSNRRTEPVGCLEPNAWGLHDMLGNVYEWCQDATAWPIPPYTDADTPDPVSTTGSHRVIRGGSWGGVARYVRAASRFALRPGNRYARVGFRLAGGAP